jgi:hypothetical protein
MSLKSASSFSPQLTWRSPNHVHLFWRVTGFDRDLVERLQKKLACEQ